MHNYWQTDKNNKKQH